MVGVIWRVVQRLGKERDSGGQYSWRRKVLNSTFGGKSSSAQLMELGLDLLGRREFIPLVPWCPSLSSQKPSRDRWGGAGKVAEKEEKKGVMKSRLS